MPLVGYYRIHGNMYAIEAIRKLIDTQDANIIDQDLTTSPMHKHHRDKEMYMAAAMGRNVRHIAKQYGWHHGAVSLAVERFRAWQDASPDYAIWDKSKAPAPEPVSAEHQQKIDKVLSVWLTEDEPQDQQDPPLVPQTQQYRHVDLDENGNECYIDDEGNRTPIDS